MNTKQEGAPEAPRGQRGAEIDINGDLGRDTERSEQLNNTQNLFAISISILISISIILIIIPLDVRIRAK